MKADGATSRFNRINDEVISFNSNPWPQALQTSTVPLSIPVPSYTLPHPPPLCPQQMIIIMEAQLQLCETESFVSVESYPYCLSMYTQWIIYGAPDMTNSISLRDDSLEMRRSSSIILGILTGFPCSFLNTHSDGYNVYTACLLRYRGHCSKAYNFTYSIESSGERNQISEFVSLCCLLDPRIQASLVRNFTHKSIELITSLTQFLIQVCRNHRT